ncbi:hypothetical protein IPZ58_05230 [Streptomyces roseoverticillatus]|uniref:hypothetical protein n=1 Tax=Streptomyces roseoverticillatus TaxID=66429 RepID=UPI001F391E62|nr:hypothetical protein [Streptomyces roseoverticillatus]MCF3100977.1 hypothetical protein [Streptomyces roseoverticillatus]
MLRNHPVRLTSYIGAAIPLLVARWPGVDWYTLAGLVVAIVGAGEAAQRLEDAKTSAAQQAPSPWDEAADRQRRLAAKEAVAPTSST